MGNLSKTFDKLTIPLLVLLVISFFALPAQAKYGGGTGEPNDPYLIFDANQMNAIGADSSDWDKHFKLMADIGLSGFTGDSFNIIGFYVSWDFPENKPFTGVFDGNGKKISNFTYTSTGTNSIGRFGYVGLFGYVKGQDAEIKDLRLIDPSVSAGEAVGSLVGWIEYGTISNCYIEGGSVLGASRVGGLVGDNDYGTISNCYSTGSVTGYEHIGGLVGHNEEGTITNCYSEGSVSGDSRVGGLVGFNEGTIINCYCTGSVSAAVFVGGLVGQNGYCYWDRSIGEWYCMPGTISNCYSTGSVSGVNCVGGLVGRNWGGTITNSYATASVSGNGEVGGLVGNNGGTISNCYATGSVSGTGWYVGGLVGKNDGDVWDSFWDIETGGPDNGIGTPLPTEQMQMASTFTDARWDFNTPVWTIDEGMDYPRLWWELVPVLHAEPELTLGTSNTITWDPVPGANDYYAECAEDANFTSIVYATGWITEASYKFTSLELGRRYWYSVKARNSAGTETDWSNVESSLQGTLADAVDIMLDPDTLKNKNLKNALINKINTVQQMLDAGLYADALDKLENDILQKTNGCADTGRPDKNDWIKTCEAQDQVYPLIIETIELLENLI